MADGNTLAIELANITGTNMYQLNDDCLLEIFSCNSVAPMDLCSLADCKRFKQIAQRVFPKGFEIYSITEEDHFFQSLSSKRRYYVTVDDCERILRNFGPRLSQYNVHEDAVLNSVAKYCDGVALDHLIIDDDENVHRIAGKLN